MWIRDSRINMIFEGTNVRGSLALSLALTRGNRLKILGVALILMSLTLVPFLLGYLVGQVEGPDVSLLVVLPMIAVTLILFFLLSCLWPLVALILYQDLRALKDGSRVPAPEVSGAACKALAFGGEAAVTDGLPRRWISCRDCSSTTPQSAFCRRRRCCTPISSPWWSSGVT